MLLFYLPIFATLWDFSGAADEQLVNACEEKPKDCAEVQWGGKTKSGIYTIYPRLKTKPVRVYCDLVTDGGGWTVFQRRMDGSEDFYMGWKDYRRGFGRPELGEYWLGLDNIHWISRRLKHELRVELEDWSGNKRYADYDRFYIEGAGTQYKLYLSAYHGNAGVWNFRKHIKSRKGSNIYFLVPVEYQTWLYREGTGSLNIAHPIRECLLQLKALLGIQYYMLVSSGRKGDSLAYHNGMMFTTKDRDNDNNPENCAVLYHGAWWYDKCHKSNLNGLYHVGGVCPPARGVIWYTWKGHCESMKCTEMKLRPINFH